MSTNALSKIRFIYEMSGVFLNTNSFPEATKEPDSMKEEALQRTIERCKERLNDYNTPLYMILQENQKAILGAISSLSITGIDIMQWCSLLMCAIKELDEENRILKIKMEQMERHNKKKERMLVCN